MRAGRRAASQAPPWQRKLTCASHRPRGRRGPGARPVLAALEPRGAGPPPDPPACCDRHGWRWTRADRRAFLLVAQGRNRNGVRVPAGWDTNYDLASWVGSDRLPDLRPTLYPQQGASGLLRPSLLLAAPLHRRAPGEAAPLQPLRRDLRDDPPVPGVLRALCQRAAEVARISAARRDVKEGRTCEQCGGPLPVTMSGNAKFCSHACQLRAFRRSRDEAWREASNARRREKRRLAKLNGHANPNGRHHEDDPGSAADTRPNGAASRERGPDDRLGAGAGAPSVRR